MKPKPTFRTTKIKLSAVQDDEVQRQLQGMFIDTQVQKSLGVEMARKATIAMLEAQNMQNEATIRELRLVAKAAEVGGAFEPLRTNPLCFVYNEGSDVIFEVPFTERDMRNAVRLQRANLNQQIKEVDDEGSGGLYEGDPNPDPEDPS
jgi:hypothetical protein